MLEVEYGFIETPNRKVKDGKVTNEVVYLDASQEATEVIADAGVKSSTIVVNLLKSV